MGIKLKPCPFCNGEAKIIDAKVGSCVIKTNLGEKDQTNYYAKIMCKDCGVKIEREWSYLEMGDKKIVKCGETIFDAWNRRATNG